MKVAITASNASLEGPFEAKFGRASGFIIYDTDTKSCKYIDNKSNAESMQGAGIGAATSIIEEGAEVLITGHCGPKAASVLNTAKISVFSSNARIVRDALNDYLSGSLAEIDVANPVCPKL